MEKGGVDVVEDAGEGAEDGAGLEAAVQDVRGQDGAVVGLVFGVAGVRPEGGHFVGYVGWDAFVSGWVRSWRVRVRLVYVTGKLFMNRQ